MRRCLELGRLAAASGDTWVGSLIGHGTKIIAEDVERVKASGDITAHAEIDAVKAACKALNTNNQEGCVLYTTAEPCFLCSYLIRQARIRKVVIGRRVSGVGGVSSKFPILTDATIDKWSAPPAVVTGILAQECEQLIQKV